ncbi:MAG: hypothetical protein Q4B64_00815 [Spirochaetales bacterium]|nr:hypothetical protein [Spirochaetales bacterium]
MKKSFTVIPILMAAFVFCGCDNFMEGTDLRNRIAEEIELANAPLVNVHFEEGKGGNIDPRGKKEIQIKHNYALSYLRDEEYQFTQWQVFLNGKLLTDNESDYVQFEDKWDTTTQVKILQNVSGLKIKPLCYERPVVLSRTPVETSGGSYRDARVIVNFSQPMDESSIYYNSAAEVPDHDSNGLLEVTVNGERKIYGYKKNGVLYFKNIEIINLNTQENLLSHYENPVFETPTRLSISAVRNNEPPKGVQILVTVSKNMCAKGSKAILKTSEVWNYFCNNNTDKDGPVVSSIKMYNKKFNANTFSELEVPTISGNTVLAEDVQNIYLNDNSIRMNINITDSGSGVNSGTMKYRRIYDEKYKKLNTADEEIECPLILTFPINKNNAYVYKTDAEPFEFKFDHNDPDGIYEVYFEFRDVNGNSSNSEEKFYVLKDNTAPDCTYSFESAKNAITLKNNSGNGSDIAKVNVTYKNLTQTTKDQNESIPCTYSGDKFTVSGLQNTSTSFYEMKIDVEDYFGNKSSKTIKVLTKPEGPAISEADFIKKYPAGSDTNTTVRSLFNNYFPGKTRPSTSGNCFASEYLRKPSNLTPLPDLFKNFSVRYYLYNSSNTKIKEFNSANDIKIPDKNVRGTDKYYLSFVVNCEGTNVESERTMFDFKEYCADEFYMWGGFNDGRMYFIFGFTELNSSYKLTKTSWEKFLDRNLTQTNGSGTLVNSSDKNIIYKDRIMYDYTQTPGNSFRYTLLDENGKNMGQIIFTQQSDKSDPNIEFRPGER